MVVINNKWANVIYGMPRSDVCISKIENRREHFETTQESRSVTVLFQKVYDGPDFVDCPRFALVLEEVTRSECKTDVVKAVNARGWATTCETANRATDCTRTYFDDFHEFQFILESFSSTYFSV